MTIHSHLKSILLMCVFGCAAFAAMAPLSSTQAIAAIEAVEFDDPAVMQRYQHIIAELRCLVCQNQTLADSDAGLAKDLRRKAVEMLNQGKTDQEIFDYMRDRYGDFVLYRPPLSLSTSLIWLGPFVLLLIAVAALLTRIKHRQQQEGGTPASANDDAQRIKVRELMNRTPELTKPNHGKDK